MLSIEFNIVHGAKQTCMEIGEKLNLLEKDNSQSPECVAYRKKFEDNYDPNIKTE